MWFSRNIDMMQKGLWCGLHPHKRCFASRYPFWTLILHSCDFHSFIIWCCRRVDKVCLSSFLSFFFSLLDNQFPVWASHQLNLSPQEGWAYMIHSNILARGKTPSKVIVAQIKVLWQFYRWMLGWTTRWRYMKLNIFVFEFRVILSDYWTLTISESIC